MKKIFINHEPWQTRIAIVADGELQHIYFDAHATQNLERSFFKGVVSKVLPGIQTAFVDIGHERAGFLHISEIDRELAIKKISRHSQLDDDDQRETKPERTPRNQSTPDIGNIFKERDQILVQVSKEPVYEKGAKLSTCFILPGRFLVLMPNIPRVGVSKKIENKEERVRLKNLIRERLPEGMGAIIRTTSEDRDEKAIFKDLDYLVKTWQGIVKKYESAQSEECIYEDLDLSLQIIRDHLDDDVEAIIVDDKTMQSKLYHFIKNIAPEYSHIIKHYSAAPNIFTFYDIERQIEEAVSRKVELKSGGSLIIESTEAMTVIDVNTGKFTGKSNLEETILKTNLEAAEEIARQLRLRNIGGLIVIDFIDMSVSANKRKVFHFFEKTLKEKDKFQSVLLKISEFGIVQMTRKRSGKTLTQQLMEMCHACTGLGVIKSHKTECYELLRLLKHDLHRVSENTEVTIHINPMLFDFISNHEYNSILMLEKLHNIKITLTSNPHINAGKYKLEK